MVKLKTILDTRRAKSDGSFSILFRVTNYKDVKYIITRDIGTSEPMGQ